MSTELHGLKRHVLWLGFAAALVAATAVGYAAHTESDRYYYWSKWISHTQVVLETIEEERVELFKALTALATFYQTGDSHKLDELTARISKIRALSSKLRALTSDNPRQEARLQQVDSILGRLNSPFHDSMIQPMVPEAGETVTARPASSVAAAFYQLRQQFYQMSAEENRLLNERLARAQTTSRRSIATMAVGACLVFLWLLVVSAYAQVTAGRLSKAARNLADTQEQLVRAEERRKAGEQFRALLESAPDAMVLVDSNGRIVLVNAQSEALFGYSRKELVGQHIELLIPERFHTRHSEYRKEYFKSPKPRHSAPGVDLTGLRRDGSEFTAEISLSPIATPQGNLVTAAVRDITERIRLEQEQYRKISEASRLKSEFLANMSHELRTPLNAIIGFASLIHSKKVGPLNDDQTDYMSDILTSSRHLLQLINDVLDLAKIEAGKMEFRSEPFDVVVKIDEVIDTLRALAAEKHIRISSNVAPDLTTVNIDPAKFKQVLYNYLSNAIKFTPENGSITVRAWREGNDWFRLEVEDTGIGIAPEDVARLFVEFQQLDASPTKRFGGTGLGLSLTKRIAEAQGGSVSVRSELGKGSTFGALLPLTMAHSDERPAPPPLPQINGARPLLVIEDDARDRDWLARMLANAGYPVEVAATGAEAIRLCNQKAFAAITLDLLLPDTSGWEVLREIRATPLNRQVPAIVVTLSRDQGLSSAFILQDYLVKPVEEHALLQSLKQAGVYPSDGVVLVVDNDLPTLELVTANLNQLGYRTVCKDSAEEALELVRNQPPRVIVLELLLPGMSGFQFLDELRSTLEGRQIPVIVWSTKDLTSEERLRLRDSAQAIVPRDSVGELVKQLSSLTGLQREQSSNLRGSV